MRVLRYAVALIALSLVMAACGSATPDVADDPTSGSSNPAESPDGGESPGDQVAACGPLDEPATVVVSAPYDILLFAPFLLAEHFGEFEANNITIKKVAVAAPDVFPMLGSGEVDVAVASITAGVLNAIQGGVDMRWAAPSHLNNPESRSGIWVSSELWGDEPEGEFDFGKLEGRTIGATGVGGTVTYAVGQHLEQAGLTLDDVEFSRLGPGDILVALEQGSVDAGWLIDPIWLQADDNQDLMFAGTMPLHENGGAYLTGESLFEDNRDVGVAFYQAMGRTIQEHLTGDYLNDPETLEALVEVTGQSEESLKAVPPPTFDPRMEIVQPDWLVSMQEMFLDADIVDYDEPLPVENIVDQSLVEEAVSCGL